MKPEPGWLITAVAARPETPFGRVSCPCCGRLKIDARLIKLFDALATRVGPLAILSGYRCPEHNAHVGSKPTSQHVFGMAIDAGPGRRSARSIKDIHTLARTLWFVAGTGGFGRYPWGIHVDIGPVREWSEL